MLLFAIFDSNDVPIKMLRKNNEEFNFAEAMRTSEQYNTSLFARFRADCSNFLDSLMYGSKII